MAKCIYPKCFTVPPHNRCNNRHTCIHIDSNQILHCRNKTLQMALLIYYACMYRKPFSFPFSYCPLYICLLFLALFRFWCFICFLIKKQNYSLVASSQPIYECLNLSNFSISLIRIS